MLVSKVQILSAIKNNQANSYIKFNNLSNFANIHDDELYEKRSNKDQGMAQDV